MAKKMSEAQPGKYPGIFPDNIPQWEAPSSFPPLSRQEAHVWRIDIGSVAQEDSLSCLTHAEQMRATAFHHAGRARQFIIMRGVLRRILAAYLDADAARINIVSDEAGRLRIGPRENAVGLDFNVAHSRDFGLIAIASAGRIGVDIEFMRPARDLTAIARRFFAPAESEALARIASGDRESTFYQCWTLKEACLKMQGMPLVEGLAASAVRITPGTLPQLRLEPGAQSIAPCSTAAIAAAPGYAAAAVVQAVNIQWRTFAWHPALLLHRKHPPT